MKKLVVFLFVLASVFCFSQAFAGSWGFVVNSPDISNTASTSSIHTIDLGKSPPVVYGPFLEGELSTSTGPDAFDITLLKNKKHALVSVFGEQKVHRIDIQDPKNPVLAGTIQLDFFAEDIAVSPNGKFALVTDGGFAPYVAFINPETFTVTATVDISATGYANAVAIAKDNKTVLFADYFGGKIHYGTVNDTMDGFNSLQSIWLCDTPVVTDTCTGNLARPVNIATSPNGKTALAAVSNGGLVIVLSIQGKKGAIEVVPGNPFFLSGLPGGLITDDPIQGGNQSITFRNNKEAYVLSNFPDLSPQQLSMIRIVGPGQAEIGETGIVDLLATGSSQLFGVDVLAIKGSKAIAGHPTIAEATDNPNYSSVAYVDLKKRAVTPVPLNINAQPIGVAIK